MGWRLWRGGAEPEVDSLRHACLLPPCSPFCLSKSYKLAVVSDAWPSLENVFRAVGLRDYFSSFIISSQKGITKPHELMYKTALEELGVLPEEAIFIDDNIKNCDGAMKLGINSFVLCRDFKSYIYHKIFKRNYTAIRSLKDINKLLR